jgi:hypothetical protein
MHVPFRHVPIFLGGPLSPWEAIQLVYGALQGDNKLEECHPLLNFLKVCMSRAGPHNVPVTVQLLPVLAVPPDHFLIDHVMHLIRRDITALDPTPVAHGATLIASGLDNLVEEQRRAREDAEEHARESTTKTIGGVFGEQGELRLLCLCQVANSNMLPTIYQTLADVPKASWLQTLQDAMDEVAETISYGRTHIATPSLLKKVMALQYVIVDPDHLEDGIHHFTVT